MVLPPRGFLLSRAHGVPDYSRTRLPPCGPLQPRDGRGGPGVLRSGRRLRLAVPSLVHPQCENCVKDGLEVVERVMKNYRAVALPGLPRFTGGAVGFIGYEFIHDVEPVVPRPTHD